MKILNLTKQDKSGQHIICYDEILESIKRDNPELSFNNLMEPLVYEKVNYMGKLFYVEAMYLFKRCNGKNEVFISIDISKSSLENINEIEFEHQFMECKEYDSEKIKISFSHAYEEDAHQPKHTNTLDPTKITGIYISIYL